MTQALVFAGWLLLNGSASPGNLLIAALLALVVPPLVGAGRVRLRALPVALRLAGTVLWDIVRSNLDVTRRVLGADAAIHPRFVWVPLDLQSPPGIVVLASIITLTPGTVSAELSPDRRRLLVHALHTDGDGSDIVADIKQRYEAPLREIFE